MVHESLASSAFDVQLAASAILNGPDGSAHASVAVLSPETIPGTDSSESSSSGNASATVEKKGPGNKPLPSSSNRTASSMKPMPAPPASSETDKPSQPSSAT